MEVDKLTHTGGGGINLVKPKTPMTTCLVPANMFTSGQG